MERPPWTIGTRTLYVVLDIDDAHWTQHPNGGAVVREQVHNLSLYLGLVVTGLGFGAEAWTLAGTGVALVLLSTLFKALTRVNPSLHIVDKRPDPDTPFPEEDWP